jgi:membrane protein involved in colicin uptake
MTGLLVLSADPSANLGAATKQYVDTAEADAISTAAADATTKANAAQAAAEATAAADATTKANAAQAAAEVTAAADATTKANAAQAAAEATAAAANTAQQNGTTSFTAINYNSVAKQVAATTGNIVTAAETTAISWVAADYRSAKFVVKVKNGVHTQVSDLVVTLDTSNNVAVSEYGITYSNGTELAAVTADYSGSDVRIRVTPANANTEVIVVGTLIK